MNRVLHRVILIDLFIDVQMNKRGQDGDGVLSSTAGREAVWLAMWWPVRRREGGATSGRWSTVYGTLTAAWLRQRKMLYMYIYIFFP